MLFRSQPLKSTSLNWDEDRSGDGPVNAPILNPRDAYQVAFLLEEEAATEEAEGEQEKAAAGDTRRILGQLEIHWRSASGDRGSLSTGWLKTRR